MVDIETLDTEKTGVILSIAAVAFDPWTGEHETVLNVNLDAGVQTAYGRTVSKDTVMWWFKQDVTARRRAFASDEVADLQWVLAEVMRLVNQYDHVWANDPDFDCEFIRNLLNEATNTSMRWPFWKHRSVRTVRAMFAPVDGVSDTQAGHDPEQDCILQIADVHARLKAAGVPVWPPLAPPMPPAALPALSDSEVIPLASADTNEA